MKLKGLVEKGWGSENIWVTNDKYCGKLLNFNEGSKFSMHFHREKEETWYIMSGEFVVEWIDCKDAKVYNETLHVGDVWHNAPLLPHRLICVKEGSLMEVSTADSVEDNYRVMPGDSQA